MGDMEMEEIFTLLNQKIGSLETMASLLDYDVIYDYHNELTSDYHYIDFYHRDPKLRFRLDLNFSERKIAINHMSQVTELSIQQISINDVNEFFEYPHTILSI